MYSATFTFAKGEYDDEFHQRDQAIAELAKSIPGYLGEEAWENTAHPLAQADRAPLKGHERDPASH